MLHTSGGAARAHGADGLVCSGRRRGAHRARRRVHPHGRERQPRDGIVHVSRGDVRVFLHPALGDGKVARGSGRARAGNQHARRRRRGARHARSHHLRLEAHVPVRDALSGRGQGSRSETPNALRHAVPQLRRGGRKPRKLRQGRKRGCRQDRVSVQAHARRRAQVVRLERGEDGGSSRRRRRRRRRAGEGDGRGGGGSGDGPRRREVRAGRSGEAIAGDGTPRGGGGRRDGRGARRGDAGGGSGDHQEGPGEGARGDGRDGRDGHELSVCTIRSI
mmetsp:Transcript_2709/g.10605  ORF Transcript_2709/g.10605 Transcript_2709/m.10605 type:complete len:276 (-) Transcript_2709:1863-2690(-)